jgi:hypothetical protein
MPRFENIGRKDADIVTKLALMELHFLTEEILRGASIPLYLRHGNQTNNRRFANETWVEMILRSTIREIMLNGS